MLALDNQYKTTTMQGTEEFEVASVSTLTCSCLKDL